MKIFKKKRIKSTILILLPLILAVSLLFTGTVFADDGGMQPEAEPEATVEETAESPADETAEEAVPVEDDSVIVGDTDPAGEAEAEGETEAGTEAGGGDDVVQDETRPSETGSDDEEQVESAASETEEKEEIESDESAETGEAELSDTTAALAEEDLILVDESGEFLDMASQESQEAISSADPWWKVGKTKYAFIKTGGTCPDDADYCFESDVPISDALAYMDTNDLVPSDGILHVEADSYTENITVDGSAGNLAALKGIVSEGSSVDTTITGNVTINNTTKGFTLRGFNIIGSLSFNGNIGTISLCDVAVESSSGSGISINNHNGAVKVEQVAADSNNSRGMVINNTAASKSSITIINSQFQNNGSNGLDVASNGKITLEGVSASDNGGYGVVLDGLRGTVIKGGVFSLNTIHGIQINTNHTSNPVSITDVRAAGNGGYGIYASTGSKITLINVSTNDNINTGIYIDTTDGSKATVKMNTVSANGNTGGNGIDIQCLGTVSLMNISASSNNGIGLLVNNCQEYGGVCTGKGGVKINGSANEFNLNGIVGAAISSGGSVSLSNIKADGNLSGSGLDIDQRDSAGKPSIKLSATKGYTNSLSNNSGYGALIQSTGSVSLTSLIADGNNQNGVVIEADGIVSLSKISADGNAVMGIYINNTGSGSGRSVKLSSVESNSNVGDNGIDILSLGTVSLKNVSAGSNNGYGLSIDNCREDGVMCIGRGGVKISGSANEFNLNGYGAYISTGGSVSLSNISADGNLSGKGLNIDQRDSAGTPSVKLSASKGYTNSFSNNYLHGIQINSPGSVSLMSFIVEDSGLGVDIQADGRINLSKVKVEGNSHTGVNINNTGSGSGKSVNLSSVESNSSINENGIYIQSLGTVSLKNVSASSNNGFGLLVNNCQEYGGVCTGKGGVKISGSANEFNLNGIVGAAISSGGSVSLSNISADENLSGSGLDINQMYSAGKPSIKLSATKGYTNSLSNNSGYGALIKSPGNVSLTSLIADGNNQNGVVIEADGIVSLSKISADGNAVMGIYINNTGSGSGRSVKLSSVESNSNIGDNGIDILSLGTVSLKNVSAGSNNGYGLSIDNCREDGYMCTGSGWVKISGSANEFNLNGYGAYIGTGGSVSLSNISADGNLSGYGLEIDQRDSAGTPSVKLSASKGYTNSFSNNGRDGISIQSPGSASLTRLVAENNHFNGLNINVDGMASLKSLSAGSNGSNGVYVITGDTLKISSANLNANTLNGLNLIAGSDVYLTKVQACANGDAANDWDGLNLIAGADAIISIKYSLFCGNYGDGIQIAGNTSPNLYKTYYYGNNMDYDGDKNLNLNPAP